MSSNGGIEVRLSEEVFDEPAAPFTRQVASMCESFFLAWCGCSHSLSRLMGSLCCGPGTLYCVSAAFGGASLLVSLCPSHCVLPTFNMFNRFAQHACPVQISPVRLFQQRGFTCNSRVKTHLGFRSSMDPLVAIGVAFSVKSLVSFVLLGSALMGTKLPLARPRGLLLAARREVLAGS